MSPTDDTAGGPVRDGAGTAADGRVEPDRVAQRETVVMYNALAYVLAGPLTFGLAGWLVDAWLDTTFAVLVGIIGGMALSLYYVWFRYGTQ